MEYREGGARGPAGHGEEGGGWADGSGVGGGGDDEGHHRRWQRRRRRRASEVAKQGWEWRRGREGTWEARAEHGLDELSALPNYL